MKPELKEIVREVRTEIIMEEGLAFVLQHYHVECVIHAIADFAKAKKEAIIVEAEQAIANNPMLDDDEKTRYLLPESIRHGDPRIEAWQKLEDALNAIA